ncbi:hypothetical protein Q73A0000_14050 [Kaistella flava (ex Peng et al. 2021)]|uniref:Uncharacterized protein n=1 Tax=Kaistella flava (ex Peng et al. 2021) TaxID=2038776 RepID=A0A7M2YDD3_9FLAO|nr:hypothetical protein [Kaistella flava (ex Peng et al. 2021)]QOW11403.1 hypothetical protein Q73A0000_14050 [Kaistella flava (ex Peng et al. 2021)]
MDTEKRVLNELRIAVSKRLGKEISSSIHCDELSSEISKIGFIINPQTFRRFFNLIKNSGKFHIYTLDTLSKYCEFNDYADFKKSLIESELDLFLGDLGTESKDLNYWALSKDLCQKISDSPSLLANVHHKLLKYPLARTFFMEHHPMRDLAGTVYAQYFQDYLKYEDSNEAKLFAFGFLYMGAFLTENEEFMSVYSRRIRETELSPEVYVLPAARKFGVLLIQSWMKKDEDGFSEIYKEMLKAREDYKDVSKKSVCSFEYAVLEHLIFTDKTEEMRFLIEHNTFQVYNDREFVPQDRKENHDVCWNIMCAMAYLKMKEYTECERYLNQVNLENLSLGWKKHYSILYYFVKYEFADSEDKFTIENKLAQLIEETHFTYYAEKLCLLRTKPTKKENSIKAS